MYYKYSTFSDSVCCSQQDLIDGNVSPVLHQMVKVVAFLQSTVKFWNCKMLLYPLYRYYIYIYINYNMQDVSISFVNQQDIFGTSHLVILWNLSDLETLRPSHYGGGGKSVLQHWSSCCSYTAIQHFQFLRFVYLFCSMQSAYFGIT